MLNKTSSLTAFRAVQRCASLALVASLAVGCGPIQSSTAISETSERLVVAERLEAERYARYRYRKARLLLAEAKLKHGHGHYEIARQWATEAGALATDAASNARARKELERRRLRFKKGSRSPKGGMRPLNTGSKAQKSKKGRLAPKTRPGALKKPPVRRRILPPKIGERRQILPPRTGK